MDHEVLKTNLIAELGSHFMNMGQNLKQASYTATRAVDAFERSAVAEYTPATGGIPPTPKLAPGDELLVVNLKTRYRPQFVQVAEVVTMARYRVRVRWTCLESERVREEDFDIRTRNPWVANRSADRMVRASTLVFFTQEQWAYELRARLADDYLKERGIYPSSVRGPLSGLLNRDPVGFANALRRLEGLVEL